MPSESLFRVIRPSDSTVSRISIAKDSEVEFVSESVAVTVTVKIPFCPPSAVKVSVDSSRVKSTGEVSPVNPVIETFKLRSPSISSATMRMFFVCPLWIIISSSGAIEGGCPRRLVSADAALILPPVTVLPLRLCSGSTVLRIALVTSVTDIPGLAALRRPTTPATWGAAIEVPLKDPYEFPGNVE